MLAARCGERACTRLAQAVDLDAYRVLGFCWRIRGEFDMQGALQNAVSPGQRCASCQSWEKP